MIRRWLWFSAGWAFVALGVVGVALPGVPTTFPMILALGCFARSSRRFHDWLYYHRYFGPPLQRWVEHRVIPRAGKIGAVAGMSLSLTVLLVTGALAPLPLAAVAALMVIGAAYVLRCPSELPRRSQRHWVQ